MNPLLPSESKVFVLGAGFTNAFLPKSPFLIDHYNGDLDHALKGLPYAYTILEAERRRHPGRKIDIERLMTRLDGPMPYDSEYGELDEMAFLLSRLKRSLVDRITVAKKDQPHAEALDRFAKYCVYNQVTCITFNYDDVLDEALWRAKGTYLGSPQVPYWHPDGGYGFFCKPSRCVIRDQPLRDIDSNLFLKLHGSINWYPIKGCRSPYALSDVVHHEDWFQSFPGLSGPAWEMIASHLELEPFIVPPVLAKSAFSQQPILQIVWTKAFEQLGKAKRVVFVGYSFPVTDLAAQFLFQGAIRKDCRVEVVNDKRSEEAVQRRYTEAFSGIAEPNFNFEGALAWSLSLPEPTDGSSGAVFAVSPRPVPSS